MQRYILMCFFLNGLGTSEFFASTNSRKGDFLAPGVLDCDSQPYIELRRLQQYHPLQLQHGGPAVGTSDIH